MTRQCLSKQCKIEQYWFVILGAIVIIGLFLRSAYLFQVSKTVFFLPLTLDPASYEKTASEILSSNMFMPKGVFYQSPLYPYLLALLRGIFCDNLVIIRFLQVIMDASIPLLVFFLSRNFFSVKTSLVASFLTSLYGPLLYESALGDKTTVAVLFFTLATLISIKAYKKQKWWFFAGVAWGISALVRENSLLVGIIISCLFGKKKFWQGIIGLLIVVIPITLSNLRNGDFVIITSQAGQNFYIGNSEYATGSYIAPPFVRATPEYEQEDFKGEAELQLGRSVKPSTASAYWLKEAIEFIIKNPQRTLSLCITKVFLLTNSYEIPDNYNYDFMKEFIPILKLPLFNLWLIGPLSIMGLFFAWKKKTKNGVMILYTTIATYSLTMVSFFVVGRYRILLIPLIMPFAAFGITLIFKNLIAKKWRMLFFLMFLFIPSYVLVNHRQDHYPISKNYAKEYYMLGNAYRRLNRLEEAIKQWELALIERPNYKTAENDISLAKKFLRVKSLQQQLIMDSMNTHLLVEYAALLFDIGDDSLVLIALNKALTIDPNNAEAWSRKGLLYSLKMNNFEKAKIAFENAIRHDSANARHWANLGNCHFELGDKKNALYYWKRSYTLNPKNTILKKNILELETKYE